MVTGHGYITDDLADHAIKFIETNRDRPFFCYVPFYTPHSPMQVPDRFWAKFKDAPLQLRATNPKQEDIDFTRAALAMCESIDFNVGRILAKLDELKLAENTIVIYFSDNGPNSWRWNGGMKGRKGSTDEGGVRSPCFIRWPGTIRADTRVAPIAAAIDLLPTLADCAGVQLDATAGKPLDGRSLKPLLLDHKNDWPQRMLFSHWNRKVSVRTDRYRLDDDGALFDMEADPGQRQNIAPAQPKIVAELSKAMTDWRKELLTKLWRDDRPFTVGYREFPMTQLPARDGVPHGNIHRSASAPNCSYFTNWTSPDDSITWDIEVHTAGAYEAAIYYTCPAADVGSTIELTCGQSTAKATVAQANDPPSRGMEHDRVERKGESYVKDFKPLQLGTFDLPTGRGKLTLRALKIPGKSAMDVRMVTLTLK
jgi:hypothetical protein